MTIEAAPQWLQTVTEKRTLRENAIQRFLEVHQSPSEVTLRSSPHDLD